MKISVILATYNCGKQLDCCVQSIIDNNDPFVEIIFADDGSSNPESLERLKKWEEVAPFRIVRAWQEDKGFRLARSRNNAVSFANGEILLFIDHDILLPNDFFKTLRKHMIPGWFIGGRRVKLDERISSELLSGKCTCSSLQGFFFAFQAMQKRLPGWRYLFPLRNRQPGGVPQNFRGMAGFCIATYKTDFFTIDGFDSSFEGYGVEDWDFMARLNNSGISCGFLPRKGTVYHLWHPEKPDDLKSIAYKILDDVEKSCKTLPSKGFSKLI
ncbi:glycosyl transferase [Desulfocapsa sulfexigens DSM 10523]|uniref:Glycosyl transferase n=1 Tax=Desulfocapsa sulfexigens (strain DSM 10523 / SB164P1) TaxID=1167006 RepID=M1P8W6_DESSD|nr:glycosyltransferase [Desulfocapsa sulfexigens]AGF79908.1 glycosyl transferase [Desulfocapsa sulfexigens DSM 10523]